MRRSGIRLSAFVLSLCALAVACGSDGRRGPERPRQPRTVDVDSWALICPAGTELRGQPPPDGLALFCQRPGGVRHGPFLRWRGDGRLAAFGEYAGGQRAWVVACAEQSAQCQRIQRALF